MIYSSSPRDQVYRIEFCAGRVIEFDAEGDADYADKSNDWRSVSGTVLPEGARPSDVQVARRVVLRCRPQKQSMSPCVSG